MEHCNNFSHDLKLGKEGEYICSAWLKENTLMEVKRDMGAIRTGNIAIEIKRINKHTGEMEPSGISTTKSARWSQVIDSGDVHKTRAILMFDVATLKKNLKILYAQGRIKILPMGDNNKTFGFIVPMSMTYLLML
jgi:hypothetical protein